MLIPHGYYGFLTFLLKTFNNKPSQSKQMKPYYIILFFLLAGCNTTVTQKLAPTKSPIVSSKVSDFYVLEKYVPEMDLEEVFRREKAPILIIGEYLYRIPSACLCSRSLGGTIGDRKYGTDWAGRNLNANLERNIPQISINLEQRFFGGDYNSRSIDHEWEGRSFGNSATSRYIDGNSAQRTNGNTWTSRTYSTDWAGHHFSGDLEASILGLQIENSRDYGNDWSSRILQGDMTNRNFGGEFIQSLFVDNTPFQCKLLKDNCTTELINVAENARKRVYDDFGLHSIQSNQLSL